MTVLRGRFAWIGQACYFSAHSPPSGVRPVTGMGWDQSHQDMETKLDVGAIYREYYVMVWGQALRVLGDKSAADDVAQDVFVKYLKGRQDGETERGSSASLFRMATSLALKRLRDGRRPVTGPAEAFATSAGNEAAMRRMLQRARGVGGQIAVYYYLC